MRIAVVHNEVAVADAPDEKDVLVQVEAVTSALAALDHEVACLGCSLDLEDIRRQMREQKPQLVFNLVESLGGYGSLIHLFPSLLEALAIPYTGSGADTIRLTSNKTTAKKLMRQAGLPTPDWVEFHPGREIQGQGDEGPGRTWIIKSLWEHASVGLDADSVVEADSAAELMPAMVQRAAALGGSCFAEQFISGREFNLSLLAGGMAPVVLPPAEICFTGFAAAKPQIVDYRAKWDEDSFEYRNTPRQFAFPDQDDALLGELRQLARRCWQTFDLQGYARVDFRVDADNRPWILEINANPCLSPDAGFAAALSMAQISFSQAVAAIIAHPGFPAEAVGTDCRE